MASFTKRGDSWRASVFLKGILDTATFDTKAEAQQWARKLESEIVAGARGMVIPRSVKEVLRRYRDEVTPSHRGARWEAIRINKIEREIDFANRLMTEVSKADVNAWKTQLMAKLKPSSARREYGVLRMIFNHARNEWGYLSVSPFDSIDPPPPGKPRKRRAADAEFDAILEKLGYQRWNAPRIVKDYVALAMILARETAMREGEILSLDEGSRISEKVLRLDRTKNGDERDIPLSTLARQVLDVCPAFPVNQGTFYQNFRDARAAAGVEGLTFHDLRREATSRLAKKLKNPLELAKVTGHRDLKVLISTYYAPDVSEMADALD
jgi:integrase